MPTTAPYGSWSSPITAEAFAGGAVGLEEPLFDGDRLWWIESRPSEGGRQVVAFARIPAELDLIASDPPPHRDAFGPRFSARTRVHEYGGGAYTVIGDRVVFSNDEDGRVWWEHTGGGERYPITDPSRAPRSLRYADFRATSDGEQIVCVRESHETDGQPVNEIVSFPSYLPGDPQVVASGHDFYAAPRVSPDGTRVAYLTWDHPRMPWNGTELWVAALDGSGAQRVAGGPDESIVNPEWSPDGRLHCISDRSGWWNLYRDGEPLYPAEAEFAMPLWVFGQATYAFLDNGRIACLWSSDAVPHLGLLDPDSGAMEELRPDYLPELRSARIVSDGKRLAYVGASPTRTAALVVLDPDSGELAVVARSTAEDPDPDYVSPPQPITFESGDRTAHALFYPPRNRDFGGPAEQRPPLIVMSHGGPTAQVEPALDLRTQFWTSRGFAVVDVNYGGSTGYGRAYRELLHNQWGVVDLEDCVNAARHLARTGEVDGERLAIRGGSAGGYTTLCALVFTDEFRVGASYYGIADVAGLMEDTHKFESSYDHWLVPDDKVRERSPIHYVEQLSAPVIVFQGLDDAVVPPQQAELIVAALRERGIEHEYHAYEGESHGFRKSETIKDAYEAELEFYGRILGFEPAQ